MLKKKKSVVDEEILNNEEIEELSEEDLKFKDIKAHSHKYYKFHAIKRAILRTIVYAFFLAVLIVCLARRINVSSSPMEPCISSNTVSYGIANPLRLSYKRGAIVSYNDNINNVTRIGRVIGLPNEILAISKDVIVINNDFVLQEDYLDKELKWASWNGDNKETVFVKTGKDEYFILNDGRLYIEDSRTLGVIKKEDVRAQFFITYNFDTHKITFVR